MIDPAPPVLELPADRARSAVQGYTAASVSIELARPLVIALESLGLQAECTPFMTTFAAFATLLHRYTGETDLCVGTALPLRACASLRCDLSGDPTFAELLARVRGVEAVRSTREPAGRTRHSVAFSFQDGPTAGSTAPPAPAAALVSEAAHIDLSVIALPQPGGLTLRFDYNGDLFDRETIAAMAEHYRRLLAAVTDEPQRRISRLPLMTETERRRILDFRGRRAPYERDESIDGLFARQAARTPAAIALEAAGSRLTYAQLDARANRLANHLRALGVGPETTVGLALERGVEMPVAVLAVLKAGGAYVPLEPGFPHERLAFMVQDSGARYIVTERALRDRLPAQNAFVVSIDEDAAAIAACSTVAPASASGPDSLAYVMYTSGSTGKPKGVAVVHRGVVRLVRNPGYIEIAPEDVFLQQAPLGFDASTFELWAPLLNGARLALGPSGPQGCGELGATLERFGVTTLVLTAALFHQMVDIAPEGFAGVRRLLVGGDVVSPVHARRFLARFPQAQLVNAYGPTENTTISACYTVPSAKSIGANLPIGSPISNSSAYVLDGLMQPQPLGVAGELYVGGDGLARGYVNAPELTTERFVPDPFDADPGARLYRTGDRARFRRDGALEFLGRLDQQIKIRGFRIEPGEIEAVLRAHTDVHEAAVTVVENLGERSLAAYVQAAPGSAIAEAELRAYLRAKLPEYMVPGRIALLEHLPSHVSGKLDRRALPPIPPAPRRNGDGRPQGQTEMLLAVSLGEFLGRDAIRRDDDIFELGAHSLLAMRIVANIGRSFGVELLLRDLFDNPTVAQLAAKIDAAPRSRDSTPIARAGRRKAPALAALADRLANGE